MNTFKKGSAARLGDLWSWRGTLERRPFVLWLALVALAYPALADLAALLRLAAWPGPAALAAESPLLWLARGPSPATGSGIAFVAVIVLLAASASGLALRRARAAGLPWWLVPMLLLPYVNVLVVLVLALVPSPRVPAGTRRGWLQRLLPVSPQGSGLAAALVVTPAVFSLLYFATVRNGIYGWTLFLALPFVLGLAAAVLHGQGRRRRRTASVKAACAAAIAASAGLLLLGLEGLLCIAMALPISLPLAAAGGLLGHAIQAHRSDASRLLAAMLLLMPFLIGAEARIAGPTPLIAVTTALEVDAPPSTVWRHVVAFSTLPEPTEWLFRTGLAYPIRAEIQGHGAGAVRYCVFSTGTFVEPIEVWDEPRLLHFRVEENPPPMVELNPFHDVHPPHLDGFLVSERGQFRLLPLAGGRTRLEGTTWYRHGLWPAAWWRLWSDAIIHRIHRRVLRHVAALAEAPEA